MDQTGGDEKQRQLEAKLQFYESEHQTFQNQLLVQRQAFEQELSQLRGLEGQELAQEVERLKSENSGLQAKLRLVQDESQTQTDLEALQV